MTSRQWWIRDGEDNEEGGLSKKTAWLEMIQEGEGQYMDTGYCILKCLYERTNEQNGTRSRDAGLAI